MSEPPLVDCGSLGEPRVDPPRWGALAPGGVSAVASLVWVGWAARADPTTSRFVLAAAIVAFVATIVTCRRHGAPPMRHALVLVGVTLAVAAVLPLHHSRDLYLYHAYGRVLAVHQEDPFTVPPSEMGDGTDPAVELVAPQWRDHPAMYGPVFVGLAAAVASVTGDSELVIRLAWQALAAAAAFIAVVLVARRTRAPDAVLALGLSPVLVVAVNDGHNDVVLGTLLVATVLLVERRAWVRAGAVAAIAVGVKLSVAVPVAGLAAWMMWRRDVRSSAAFAGAFVAGVVPLHLLAGGRALFATLRDNSGDDSRYAIWAPWRDARFEDLLAEGVRWPGALETVRAEYSLWATIALAVAFAVLAWRFRRDSSPAGPTVAAGLAMLLGAAYVMPWYAPMLLATAALVLYQRAWVALQVQSLFLLVAYATGPGVDPVDGVGQWLDARGPWIVLALLVAVVVWVRPEGPPRRSDRPGRVHRREDLRT